MLNDPLLSTPIPKKQEAMNTDTPKEKAKKTRRSPARSAKILTLGLSTTAMLGMSGGYALADLAQKDNSINPAPTPAIPNTSTILTPTALSTGVDVAPVSTPAIVAPQQATVIEVPVPQNAATPGAGNSSWKKQKSSGSK
jgi:hypothetical protein